MAFINLTLFYLINTLDEKKFWMKLENKPHSSENDPIYPVL